MNASLSTATGWNLVPFLEVCDIQGGTQPPKSEWISEVREGYVRMLQIRDFTQPDRPKVEYVKDSSRLKKCEDDDILIGRYGASIGKILNGLSGAYNVAIAKCIFDRQRVERDYLLCWLRSSQFQNLVQNFGSRAAQAGFNKADLGKLEIPLPPLEEQKRIAAILDAADDLRAKRRESLAELDALIQSTFLEMFGDPVTNPMGWDICSLGEIAEFRGGGTPSKSCPEFYEEGSIPWVTPKDMKSWIINSSIDRITEEAVDQSAAKLIPTSSVLIVIRSGILKHTLPIGINQVPVAVNQDMKALICSDVVDPLYLGRFLKASAPSLLTNVRGTTADNISSNVLKDLVVPVPPPDLQNRFAAIVESVEQQKAKQCAHLDELDTLFASLQSRAFKGKL